MGISAPEEPATGLMEKLEWLHESRVLMLATYAVALFVIIVAGIDTVFAARDLPVWETVVLGVVSIPAGFLLVFSLFELASYFVFIPSKARDGQLFSRVHSTHLVHPLTTAILLGLLALCIATGGGRAWAFFLALLALYLVQTVFIVRRVTKDDLTHQCEGRGSIFLCLHLILGGELITLAGGARPLSPWRLDTLPEDTWIVDVRTKPEFYWNRLQGAESYPWGAGVAQAAENRPKNHPVLVVCLSGHRSPAVAVMLRKLGFETVYNLNWGMLYLLLLDRGGAETGPFSLTRAQRDPNRRGEDLKEITVGYVTLSFLLLICAPLEAIYWPSEVSTLQQVIGIVLGLGGLILGVLSFKGLGRNFRVFGAPRRSGTLITTGVYTYIRHPMYSGVIMGLGGYALYFGSVISIPLWAGVLIFYVAKAVKEERLLAAKFPEYGDYISRTRRFIPFVY